MAVELYPHQQKAVDELSNGKILWGDVGTGKSLTAMAYFVSKVCGGTYGDRGSMRTPTDIYIITTAKKRDSLDWEHEALRFGITPDRENSAGAVRLVVDSWNNIGNYTDVHGAFFIFDEQRLVGSGSWAKAFIHIAKSNKWILLTATPGDTWLDYIPVFIANGFYKNRTEFKRRHVVYSPYSKFPKVERYLEVGRLVRLRNQLLVHMPYKRHTVRHSETIHVDYDKDLFELVVKKRWHVYEQRPIRDVAELFLVMRKVVNSDSSRMKMLRQLMQKHPRLIVFYNFDYELEMLRSLIPEAQMVSPESIQQLAERVNRQRLDLSRTRGSRSREPKPKTTQNSEQEHLSNLRECENYRYSAGVNSTISMGLPCTLRDSTDPISKTNCDTSKTENELWKTTTSNGTSTQTSRSTPETGLKTQNSSSLDIELGEESSIPMMLRLSEMEAQTHSRDLPNETLGSTTADQTIVSSQSKMNTEHVQIAEWRKANPSLSDGLTSKTSTSSSKQHSESSSFHGSETISTTSVWENGLSPRVDAAASGFQIAEWNGHKHQPIPETDRWVYLVQYVAGSEGWNCIETDAMVFYSQTYSYKNFHQAHGRIDRLNTPFTDLYYYHLMSDSMIDRAIAKSLRSKKNFNESDFGSDLTKNWG